MDVVDDVLVELQRDPTSDTATFTGQTSTLGALLG
jgi:hypothetical protein